MIPILYSVGKSENAAGYMILLALLASLIISGCATVKDSVVLVQDADGKIGQLIIATKGGSKTLTAPNTLVEVTGAEKSPSDPIQITQSQIDTIFGESIKALPPEPVIFLLYFLHASTEMTAESKSFIPEILTLVNKREFCEISIIGHTDTTGNDEYNMRLSSARAGAIRDALLAGGIRLGHIELRYHGKMDPFVPTGDNVSEPRNRVVEVVIK